jgi:hypothetical protein
MRSRPRSFSHIVRFGRLLLVMASTAAATSCSNDSTRSIPSPPPPPPLSRATVSSPTLAPNGSIFSPMGEHSAATLPSGSVAYVSMQPGTDPGGVSVSIQRQRDAVPPTIAAMINGGFDPVAILAEVGDTMLIVTSDAEGALRSGIAVVSRLRPPSVVRTVPAAQRTDVALSTGIVIVFTEPMDSSSIVNGITLQLEGAVVPSTITLSSSGGGAIQVAVQPVALLSPGSTYEIVIASSVTNLLGQTIAAPDLIPFTTSATTNGSDDLVITSFTMVDFHNSNLVRFEYAPQLLVTNPPGSPTVHITGFAAVRLGTFPAPVGDRYCISGINVAPGQTIQVFEPNNGQYPVIFTPNRPANGSAQVHLRYSRDGEAPRVVSLEGSIFPGEGPSTSFASVGTYKFCLDDF